MTVNTRNSRYGTAGGSAINVDHAQHLLAAGPAPRRVLLSADYILTTPEPGAPTRPGFTGSEAATRKGAGQTISSGTQVTLSAAEAAALVGAGKASYV